MRQGRQASIPHMQQQRQRTRVAARAAHRGLQSMGCKREHAAAGQAVPLHRSSRTHEINEPRHLAVGCISKTSTQDGGGCGQQRE